jgi:hypothetical protein
LLAFTASLLVVRCAPAATGAGVALVMANLNGRGRGCTHVFTLYSLDLRGLIRGIYVVASVIAGDETV